MNSVMQTWRYVAIVLLVACSSNPVDQGSSQNPTNGGAGGTPASGGSGGASSAGTGGTHANTGASGGAGGHNTAGHGAGGASGGNAGSSSGTGGASGGEIDAGSDAGSDQNCPPECLRAYTCAASCDKTPVNNGCCPCPAGTIDTITCGSASGYCGLPCTGAAPDQDVTAACQALTDEASCTAWQGTGFPNHCEWHTPSTPPCMAP